MPNSLATYESLRATGFSDKQASAVTSAIETSYSEMIAAQFELQDARITARFELQDARIAARFSEFETRFETRFAAIDTKFAETKAELLRWMFLFWVGQMAATVSIIFAAFKMLK